ncbi:hypothetical protein D3C81_1793390 [compost metagenome]
MQADRVEFDGQVLALDRTDHALAASPQHALGDRLRLMATHIAGKHDGTALVVLAVGIELTHHRLAECLRNPADHRARHAVQQ